MWQREHCSLYGSLILEFIMTTQKNQVKQKSLPSVFDLKGAARARRLEEGKRGNTLTHTAALHEQAVKYGYNTWEQLEAASKRIHRNNIPRPVIALLVINDFHQAIIVNRRIISSHTKVLGQDSMVAIVENLSASLDVDYEVINTTAGDPSYPFGANSIRNWNVWDVAHNLGLIDPPYDVKSRAREVKIVNEPETDPALEAVANKAIASGNIPRAVMPARNFEDVLAVAVTCPEFEHNHEPHIDFSLVVASEPHPVPGKGLIDYVVAVTLSVHRGLPVTGYYMSSVRAEGSGGLERQIPDKYRAKARTMVLQLFEQLIEKGVHIEAGHIVDESSNVPFDPLSDL
jgi:hypothetical protein